MINQERKAALLAYCRIDELIPEDEPVFEEMYWDAVAYMAGAGVSEPKEGSPRWHQYNLCVNRMVLDAWDKRGATEENRSGSAVTENRAFRLTLNQLKRTEPTVSDLDTGE